MAKIIVLMGAPGAGKGTQARLLQERLGLPQISTGDMFRALKEADTSLAREVNQRMVTGQLVSDDLTIRVVKDRTSRPDCQDGYILDGFPRTPAQADMLEDLAREQGNKIQPILINIPTELLEKRMVGRRSCPVCGEIYNVFFQPANVDNVCDRHPDTQLQQRADDNPETVHARLETYEEQTRPLLDHYQAKGILATVDGTQTPETIYQDILQIVAETEVRQS